MPEINAKIIEQRIIHSNIYVSQNLSKQLESSLNDSLDSFGKVMGALSQKFAQDYGPLTDRLREVVQLAGRIEKQRNRS